MAHNQINKTKNTHKYEDNTRKVQITQQYNDSEYYMLVCKIVGKCCLQLHLHVHMRHTLCDSNTLRLKHFVYVWDQFYMRWVINEITQSEYLSDSTREYRYQARRKASRSFAQEEYNFRYKRVHRTKSTRHPVEPIGDQSYAGDLFYRTCETRRFLTRFSGSRQRKILRETTQG